jgi:ABC-type taurine transport system ATPase subunit
MSLTEYGEFMKRWESFQALHALLNRASSKSDYLLNTSHTEDERIKTAKVALKKLDDLFDVYANVIGNKNQLHDLTHRINAPKISEELKTLNLMTKDYVEALIKIYSEISMNTNFIRNKLIESNIYSFNKVDVSNIGPFNSDQHIDFKNQFTIITGPNGSGKTTIRKKLESNFPADIDPVSGLYSLSFLIFFTEESLRIQEDNIAGFLETYGIQQNELDAQLNKFLEKLHLNGRQSRLSNKNYPSAMGERVMLNLLNNLAIRKILSLDIPFVIEDVIPILDMHYLKTAINVLRENCSQIIIFTHLESSFEQIGLNSDYYLQLDNKTNKSIILKTKK